MQKRLKFEFLNKVGLYLTEKELAQHVADFRGVAQNCFDDIPEYQCLKHDRDFFRRSLIVKAIDRDTKETVGFCSAVLMQMNNGEDILHLGLTCVSPKYRGLKLTHKLTSKVLKGYFTRISLFGNLWVSNVACVLSSLGNVAKYFENVYPSPYLDKPEYKHLEIAKTISSKYRADFFVDNSIEFDEKYFVFKGSVSGNNFEKSSTDSRFYHRDSKFNNYYKSLLNFERGDEVLQIGKVSALTFVKYFLRRILKRQIKVNNFLEA